MKPSVPRSTPDVAYRFQDGLYLNLTNRCPTQCRFCVKRPWRYDFHGRNLALAGGEPDVETAWSALVGSADQGAPFQEIVFCGFGEPTYRLSAMLEIGRRARAEFPSARLRLNTVGLGNLIHGRDITQELAETLDAVRVSLNTADGRQWRRLMAPSPEFAEVGFQAVLSFISDCVKRGLDVAATAVELPEVDLAKVETLAASLGARFLRRPLLDRL